MGSHCGMMSVQRDRRGVVKRVGRIGQGVLKRVVVKDVGRGVSGRHVRVWRRESEESRGASVRRVRVGKTGGSGVGMGGVREDVAGSGIEGVGGRGIGRSGSRGSRL